MASQELTGRPPRSSEGIEVHHGFARYNTESEQKQTLQPTELDISRYREGPYEKDVNLNQPLMLSNSPINQKTYARKNILVYSSVIVALCVALVALGCGLGVSLGKCHNEVS